MIFANTFPHCSYSCMHSHWDSKYGNKSGVKMEEEIYPLQKLYVCIYMHMRKRQGFFFTPLKKSPLLREKSWHWAAWSQGAHCAQHMLPAAGQALKKEFILKKSIGTKRTFEVLWQKTKGWITLPGPGLLLGPEHSELSWCCRRSLHRTF